MPVRKEPEDPIQRPEAAISRVEEVRIRLVQLGIDEQDVLSAILWVRENQ